MTSRSRFIYIKKVGIKGTGEIERLRTILGRKQDRPIEYDEALEVGESLLSFFKTLADQDGLDDDSEQEE
jgi:hypothetical protein